MYTTNTFKKSGSRFKMLMANICLVPLLLLGSCNDDFLTEKPISSLSPENVLSSKEGFLNHITALHYAAREEFTKYDGLQWYINQFMGTDVFCSGETPAANFRNWETFLTPSATFVARYWNWAYKDMLLQANTIITYAERPEAQGIWESEEEKNAIVAEARFFRAYTYNFLANLYGGVPIVNTIHQAPKTDFVRNTREEVYDFARQDLEFATQWLPDEVPAAQEGRIVKAAAQHLLTEVYISLQRYDDAIESASAIINSGNYELMTERFGAFANEPGDVFSDLFRTGNQNRSSGNRESIYVWQFEDQTPGGIGGRGNGLVRAFAPFLTGRLQDPDKKTAMVFADSLGRGVGWVRPNNYFLYDVWKDNWDNDIRNSEYNIRRTYYYNNPASNWFGEKVERQHILNQDTFQLIFPTIRKVEGQLVWNTSSSNVYKGWTVNDVVVYRLAETYLLRAEAYMRDGDPVNAAQDVNTVRARAKATLVSAGDVDMDLILDERARELAVEEPRHRTLVRTGTLIERVRKYNMRQDSRETIQDKHMFWPIPQEAIDANIDAELTQNAGY